jgi:hypothetical protein
VSGFSICVIGNSHTAAYYEAWKRRGIRLRPGASLKFFAAASKLLEWLRLEQGVLLSENAELSDCLMRSSGGTDRIAIEAYDAFVLIGLGVRINVTALSNSCGTVAHRAYGKVKKLVSNACFEAAIAAELQRSRAFWFVDRIRSVSDRPVLICPSPFRTEEQLEENTGKLASAEFHSSIVEQGMRVGDAIAARRGCTFVWQGPATLSAPGFTRTELSKNALRLGKSPSEDGLHMNEAYGYLMLSAMLERLDALSHGRVLERSDCAAAGQEEISSAA